MSRYDGGERRLYPGTDVLINKLGIRDQAELDEALSKETGLRGAGRFGSVV